jgi:hypothetical protein
MRTAAAAVPSFACTLLSLRRSTFFNCKNGLLDASIGGKPIMLIYVMAPDATLYIGARDGRFDSRRPTGQ